MTPLATRIHKVAEWLRTVDNYDAREIGQCIHDATPDTIEPRDTDANSVHGLMLGALGWLAEDRGWGVTASAMHGLLFGDGYAVGSAEKPIEAAASALEGLRETGTVAIRVHRPEVVNRWASLDVSGGGEVSK